MRFASKVRFYSGVFFVLFLFVSYFIKLEVDAGVNYIEFDSLLGVLIFHNLFVFAFYLLIAFMLIVAGIRRIKIA